MNHQKFLTLIAPFQDKIFRLSKRLLVSTEEAQDATQEIILKLWSKNETISTFSSLEAMSMTMTKNYCLDQLKSKRAQNISLTHDNFDSIRISLQDDLETKDSLNWVQKIINQLPEQQRIIIQLRDIEQLEFEKIAEIVTMNETAVRVTLSRARKTIREYLTKKHNYGIK